MTVLIFFIGIALGILVTMLRLAYLTAIEEMFVIFPNGKALGGEDVLETYLAVKELMRGKING